MLRIVNGNLTDEEGRTVFLRGINFAADSKLPPNSKSDDDPKSFVDSPCPLEDADEHYERLRELGFNCIRFLYTWDALQPYHPDEYDEEYIDYAIAMIRKATEHGFYVFMDPHQDIWARFSGGSGAPLWTLHAVGFDHRHFNETNAAVIWDPDATHSIKMQWASNYHRLVCQTMFTVFFAGPDYVPKCEINGVNLGTYLSTKYFEALRYFMSRVNEANIGPLLLGWESINEPGHGLIGYEHLDRFPKSRTHVKLGNSPTPFQAMLLGQGISQHVDVYKFTGFGLKRAEENRRVHPSRGTWLLSEDLEALDKKYGWTRSWPGGCVWELHGVYNAKDCELLKPFYFCTAPEEADSSDSTGSLSKLDTGERLIKRQREHGGDMHMFIDVYFVQHWLQFTKVVSSVNPEWLMFMQAPVNAPPPNMKKIYPDEIDETRTIYTPHFYDGLTLMLKRWRWLNVDAIGVMREVYANPLPALRFGDGAIRRSFADQFEFLKEEGRHRLGNIPMLMSEIGIPYDMDKKDAFTSGYWDNQIRAMDANICGLEDTKVSYCIWCYAVHNTHRYGDNFAGEDLSIWSADDCRPETANEPYDGVRAPEAVIRPTPVSVAGDIEEIAFDIRRAVFRLTVIPRVKNGRTEIYIPRYQFPYHSTETSFAVTEGEFEVLRNSVVWDHGSEIDKPQSIEIKGVAHFRDSMYSYVEPFHKSAQAIANQVGIWAQKFHRDHRQGRRRSSFSSSSSLSH